MGEAFAETIQFYCFSQSTALNLFPALLRPHLPQSNPLYNRLIAPQNHPSLNCLFAATFPPDSSCPVVARATFLFADLSRTTEPHIWLFNPLVTQPIPLSPSDSSLLTTHAISVLRFLKSYTDPLAPDQVFSPILRFGCVHELLMKPIVGVASVKDAIVYSSSWNIFNVRTADVAALPEPSSSITVASKKPFPEGMTVSRVPASQIDLVISTSTVPRIASTLFTLPNACLLSPSGDLVAWAYLGIDGSLGTLYVLPEYRGRGLATLVAKELIARLERGEFREIGFTAETGWVHADVKEGNVASEGVMNSLGAARDWVSYFTWIDGGKIGYEDLS